MAGIPYPLRPSRHGSSTTSCPFDTPKMLELTRITRLPISPLTVGHPVLNGLVGPHSGGVGAVAEFAVTCAGVPGQTGYLVDITVIDRAVREVFQAPLCDALHTEVTTGTPTDLPALLRHLAPSLAHRLPARMTAIEFRQSPFHALRLEWHPPEPTSTGRETPAEIREPSMHSSSPSQPTEGQRAASREAVVFLETFEFAASHRLALREKSDAENRALFGKCSNPNGHGHNYRLEVAVARVPMTAATAMLHGFPTIERVVEDVVMRRFDHKHLNLDCPEFQEVNPSVENIAEVVYNLLRPAFAREGGDLRYVRVWETDKTSCRYPAESTAMFFPCSQSPVSQ